MTKIKKCLSLMTVEEIKSEYSNKEILDLIEDLTAKANKIKNKLKVPNILFYNEHQLSLYNKEIEKIDKLKSIVYPS